MYYEVIYETGNHSIMNCESDDEALEGIRAHHLRAVNGEEGGPTGHPAERIVKVLKYQEHPATHGESQMVPIGDLKKQLDEIMSNVGVGDLVSVPEVTAALRQTTSPLVESAPHESNYKMEETGSLNSESWAA